MELTHPIYDRLEVKSYSPAVVHEVVVHSRLAAANPAPFGWNAQPRTFVWRFSR
jgi:hypothetical protein